MQTWHGGWDWHSAREPRKDFFWQQDINLEERIECRQCRYVMTTGLLIQLQSMTCPKCKKYLDQDQAKICCRLCEKMIPATSYLYHAQRKCPQLSEPYDERETSSYIGLIAKLGKAVADWNDKTELGDYHYFFTDFLLHDKSILSSCFAWIAKQRLENVHDLDPNKPCPTIAVCPDFVVEFNNSLETNYSELQLKMDKYLKNGMRLGWLFDLDTQQVEIYRASQSAELLKAPIYLSGEEVLPGFVLDLREHYGWDWFVNES